MGSFRPLAWFRRTPNENPAKTISIVVAVSLVCSVVVATTAVYLRPVQEANRKAEKQSHFLSIVARLGDGTDAGRADIVSHVVDLPSGEIVPGLDPDTFDAREAARDPARSIALPPKADAAGIQRRANRAVVHLVRIGGTLKMVILPVSGQGYGSVIHGYLGLSGDTETVIGLRFYEHSETPGLGGQIDSPLWRGQWYGKKVWDANGNPALGVARGRVEPNTPESRFLVDGLTGATWTSQGVTNLLRFWLGDLGFRPFLEKLRRGAVP